MNRSNNPAEWWVLINAETGDPITGVQWHREAIEYIPLFKTKKQAELWLAKLDHDLNPIPRTIKYVAIKFPADLRRREMV